MNIHVSFWLIPVLISICCLAIMFRPQKKHGGDWGYMADMLGGAFRLFWLIPISMTWAIYFAICYFTTR